MSQTPEEIIAETDAHLEEWGKRTAPKWTQEQLDELRRLTLRMVDRERLIAEVWD